MKNIAILTLLALSLFGCSQQYSKLNGQVIGKTEETGGRFNNHYYYIGVAYKLENGKYIVYKLSTNPDTYNMYSVGENVVVYGDENSVGGISKQ